MEVWGRRKRCLGKCGDLCRDLCRGVSVVVVQHVLMVVGELAKVGGWICGVLGAVWA